MRCEAAMVGKMYAIRARKGGGAQHSNSEDRRGGWQMAEKAECRHGMQKIQR